MNVRDPGARNKLLAQSALVVAHPDDEALWFSSVLADVNKIIICYSEIADRPDLSQGREAARREFPLANTTWLKIPEAGVFNLADWERPVVTASGMHIKKPKKAVIYETNYQLMLKLLRPLLTGCNTVITHNPWGEYGHEDHVQVHRAVMTLAKELQFDTWYTNYASDRTVGMLIKQLCGFRNRYLTLATNVELAAQLASLYRKHNVWTWYNDYLWFHEECLVQAGTELVSSPCPDYGALFPVNLLKVDIGTIAEPVKKQKRSLWEKLRSQMRR